MAITVAELCEQHQVRLVDLAERSELPEDRVLAIAMGRWTPSPQERTAIAQVFGIDKGDIAWGHKTPIQHIYGHGPG